MARSSKRRRVDSTTQKNNEPIEKDEVDPQVSEPFCPAPMPHGRSLLLDLPPELRNVIYGEVARSSGAALYPRGKGHLFSRSGLAGVSRSVRQEFQGVLRIAASPITATVYDFNFTHVVRFLNSLSEGELNSLPGIKHQDTCRDVRIHFYVSDRCASNPKKLQTWLHRLDSSGKPGSEILVSYHFQPLEDNRRFHYGLERTLERWMRQLPEGRLLDEVRKIEESYNWRIFIGWPPG